MATLDRHERDKLLAAARHVGRSARPKIPIRAARVMEDDDDDGYVAVRKPQNDLDERLWRLIQVQQTTDTPVGETALVVNVARTGATVLLNDVPTFCQVQDSLLARGDGLAVGDNAVMQDRGGVLTIVGFKPRKTKLSRPDVDLANSERVIAANIDTVVVVCSVVSPPLHVRILDRFLIAIQRGKCRAAIAVNKLDLANADERERELSQLDPYRVLGVPVIECSTNTGEGMAELRACLVGQLATFVGHSGVGKSSLINALKPDLGLKVGDVSEGYGRGTHTTTSSSLLDLGDLRVIDTPGIRSFGLWRLRKAELPWYFPEFAMAGGCKYRDCTHTHEPQCGVKEAVKDGTIDRARYDTYLRIRPTLR